MLPNHNPHELASWKSLSDHFSSVKNQKLLTLFKEDRSFLTKEWNNFLFDFSKNHITKETISIFKELFNEADLKSAIESMFSGLKINVTENRAVLHTALRSLSKDELKLEGRNILDDVKKELSKIQEFVGKLHSGEIKGYTGKKIKHIVNIGIGGSDLGPFMVCSALKPYWKEGITPHFVSNVDANDILEKLDEIDPETTLFIIASKTFTTQETMTNAETARQWFLKHAKDQQHVAKHFVAVSTNTDKVKAFGIDVNNMFVFWDWVGGRYSLWSAIGLSIACTVGYQNFEALLKGAEKMDDHFRSTDFDDNIPVLMAMVGIWYNNFFKAETQAILPYDHRLNHFSRYLQQGDMESNGKSVDRNGKKVDHQTGQIIWGEPGTNGQHAFYQLIHQGTKMIPADFIAAANAPHHHKDHQEKLLANFFAQTEALMTGKSSEEVKEELRKAGKSSEEIEKIAPFKVFEGNNPTTSILMKELNPESLGALIAAYEHKIFVQGVIWNVFSFDQWGVELGKQLAGRILTEIKNGKEELQHDSSTSSLLSKYFEYSAS